MVTLDMAADPAFFYFDLVVFTLDFDLAGRILEFYTILITLDCDIELTGIDGDGGLVGFQGVFFRFLTREVNNGIVVVDLFNILHCLLFFNTII